MTHLTRCYMGFLAAAVAAVFAMPAAATQWEWTFPTTGCNNVTSCTITSTVGPNPQQTLTVRAFSTPTAVTDASGNTPLTTGNWINANLFNFSGEFGIGNNVAADGSECSTSGCSPEHAVDNAQIYDIMVFELPKGMVWDIEAMRLGWARENNAGTAADIQAWFGGSATTDINFNQVCFTGCGANELVAGKGFKDVINDITGFSAGCAPTSTTGCDNNIPQNQNIFFNQGTSETQNGRYLVMTGALGQRMDAFKPEFIKANGTGGTTTAPLPGTLALLGLGLAGLAAVRRRRPTAV